MISILLFYKILELLLIMAFGFLMVKTKLVQPVDSVILSKLALFLIMPLVILNAFQVEFTRDIEQGLLLSIGAALLVHILLIPLGGVLKRWLGFTVVEQASVVYSNAGNLIIPIVASILGPEWVIYTGGFLTVQLVCLWTHCKFLFCANERADWKSILGNINIVAILIGLTLMVLDIRYPKVIYDTFASVGDMLGPVCMLVTGMIVAGMDLRTTIFRLSVYKVVFFRLVLIPAIFLFLFKVSGLADGIPKGHEILLITFLATSTPSASIVVQFAQVYQGDEEYAGAINIMTLLLCIITMPIFVYLYY